MRRYFRYCCCARTVQVFSYTLLCHPSGFCRAHRISRAGGAESKAREMNGDKEDGGMQQHCNIATRVASFLEHAKTLQSAASAFSSRLRIEEKALSQQAVMLDKEIKNLRADVLSSLEKNELSQLLAEKMEEDIERAYSMISEGDVGALLPPKSNGSFLRMLLGPVNVKAAGTDVRFKAKQEYNAYRDRTAVLFLLFPFILLLSENWFWQGCFPALPIHAYQAWLLLFYTSLALRENILRVNGSNIRPWWVYHHYCAMLMAVVALTWDIRGQYPVCKEKQREVNLFLIWAVMQGGAMLLQNRYQRQRLYTRIALGKICQCFLGFLFVKSAFTKDSEWQVLGCGLLLLIMAVGNFVNTMETLIAKIRTKSKMRQKSILHDKSLKVL
ncbi:hypothetical protein KP509_22G007900 [Ceratopteris richardii]|uniref:TMPIT-like protein n=1 Tax=Ceratopteris richardii TaxID=49495 RepID=A0A8T2S2I7_CERRI|nr:hypothetical protein KP509_22G007900 [Ceratopteris richardii]